MSIEELKKLQKEIIKEDNKCDIIGNIVIVLILGLTIYLMVSAYDYIHNSVKWIVIAFSLFFEILIYIIVIHIVKNNLYGEKLKLFKKEFKNIFILNSLKEKFSDVTYDHDKGLDKNVAKQIMDTGDEYSSNDYINAKYKNINFTQADVHIKEEREDREGNTYYVTIFLGKVMIFDFNKNFKNNVYVKSKGISYANCKYNQVEMEDITFNELFNVYAENNHDAFYLLTPSFMEKLINLKNKLNNGFVMSFIDNKLFFAINNNNDSFEYSAFKEINEDEIIKDVNKDLDFIIDLVTDLDLDNQLFK